MSQDGEAVSSSRPGTTAELIVGTKNKAQHAQYALAIAHSRAQLACRRRRSMLHIKEDSCVES